MDVGALGRSLLGHAAKAAEAGRQAVLRGTRRAAQGEWAYAALTSIDPPAVPALEPWKISIGALLLRHPQIPQLAHKALGLLDGFGAVHIGPDAVGFDGEEIAWDKVIEIRTRNAFEVMTTQALEHEVDRLRQFLPPVPGRKWVVTKAAEAIATVVLAALERGSVDQRLDELDVPVEIVHRGLMGRHRVRTGGLFAAASLVVVDQLNASLLATAQKRGIPVRPADPLTVTEPDRAARVALLRERTDAIAERLARLQQHDAAASPEGDHEPPRQEPAGEPAVDLVKPTPSAPPSIPDPRLDFSH